MVALLPTNKNLRTWPSPRVLSRPPAPRRCVSPSFLAPSYTVPLPSTSLTSPSHRPRLRQCTRKRPYIIRVPRLCIPSARIQNCPLALSQRSSPRSSLRHGLSSLCWCVFLPFSLHAARFLCVADNSLWSLLISGVLCVQAFHTSSRLAYSLSYFPLASSRASYFGTGSSFALDRSSCTARVRLHLPYS